MSETLTYYKFSEPSSVPLQILKYYLLAFEDQTLQFVQTSDRSKLQSAVAAAETKRRPSRGFSICLLVSKFAKNWSFFDYDCTKKAKFISRTSVETPKACGVGKQLPYRCVVICPQILQTFLTSHIKNSFDCIKQNLQVTHIDCSFSLYLPFYLIEKAYLVRNKECGFSKTQLSIPPNLLTSIAQMSTAPSTTAPFTTAPFTTPASNPQSQSGINLEFKPVTTGSGMAQTSTTDMHSGSIPSIQAGQNQNQVAGNQVYYPMAMKGFMGGFELDLSNLWFPDQTDKGADVSEVSSILQYCRDTQQYRNDATLILAFLAKNNCLNRLSNLTNEEKNNLDPFCQWLQNYSRKDENYYKEHFRSMKQDKKSPKTFVLDLECVYRKAHGKTKTADLSESDKRAIIRAYIKGVSNPKIRNDLASLPEDGIIYGHPKKGVEQHHEYYLQLQKELYKVEGQHVQIHPTAIRNDEITQLTQQISQLVTLQSTQQEKINQQNSQITALIASSHEFKGNAQTQKQEANFNGQNSHYSRQSTSNNRQGYDNNRQGSNRQGSNYNGSNDNGSNYNGANFNDVCRYCKRQGHVLENCFKLKRVKEMYGDNRGRNFHSNDNGYNRNYSRERQYRSNGNSYNRSRSRDNNGSGRQNWRSNSQNRNDTRSRENSQNRMAKN